MKKQLSLMLACLMLLPAAVSCSSQKQPDPSSGAETQSSAVNTESAAPTTDTEAPENTVDTDDLPSDLDYEGTEFGLFTRDQTFFHAPLNIEESNGDQLNDALFDRARAVEKRLNIVLKETLETDTTPAKLAIQGGDSSYKIVTARNVHTVAYASQGLGYHWDKVKYIDLSKDYWYDSINDNLTIANVIFTAAGAYNLSSFDYTHIIMFNKEMAAELNLESPYDLVRDGKWTFDKFAEFGAAAKNDLNGDGVMDLNDQYGFVSAPKQIPPSFWEAAGQLGIVKDSNDIPQFTMATDETFTNILLDIYKLTWDTGIWYVTTDAVNIPDSSTALFQENKALMMDSTFFYLNSFREMLSDFAILPYPKYTEEQENYLSRIEGCELPLIPSCLKQEEADMAGAFLEAMSSYSAAHTIPVYYDVYLKVKLARDNDSAEMLDTIFANRIFDLSDTVWCEQIRDGFILNLFKANNRNITSLMKRSANTVQKAIDSVVKGFTD